MSNAMRAPGEQDRSEEFRRARDVFVGSVNGWLQDLARLRDERGEFKNGVPIEGTPRITEVILGRTAVGSHNAIEHEPGVSLTGDGVATRLKLQAVLPGQGGQGYDIVQVSGRDPLAEQFHGGDFTAQASSDTVVSVRMGTIGSQPEARFGYTVYGDGRVMREHVAADGMLKRASTIDPADMAAASDSLKIIQNTLGFEAD